MLESDFLNYLHSQPHLQSSRTNRELVRKLIEWYASQESGITHVGRYDRGSGITTTLVEFARFSKSNVLYVTSSSMLAERIQMRSTSKLIVAKSWMQLSPNKMPLRNWDGFILIDDALSAHQLRSYRTVAEYNMWQQNIQVPAFLAYGV